MIQFADVARNACTDAFVSLIDSGSSIEVYGGVVPDTAEASLTGQPLLVSVPIPDAAFGVSGSVNPGEAALTVVLEATIAAGGTPTFYRLKNGSGQVLSQGEAGVSKDLNLSSGDLLSGDMLRINAFVQRSV